MFGGKAPALIWHDFMTAAMKNRKCDPFPEPKEKFTPEPFFGEYATTGAPGGGHDPEAVSTEPDADTEKDKDKKDKDGKDKGDEQSFPPEQYESPPDAAPTTPTPQAPAPAAPEVGGEAPQG
jgi:membrane peptidoglycan carboxypeptidase